MTALHLLLATALLATPYAIVFTDGYAVRALAKPEIQESLAVVTLIDGTLVSFPASRIDWGATERANLPRPVVAMPSTAAATAATVAASRRVVVSNLTIASFNAATPAGGVPAPTGEAAVTMAPPAKPLAAVVPRPQRDDLGRDPEYWRERARLLRDRRRAAAGELAAARRSLAAEIDVALHGRELQSSQVPLVVREFVQGDEERAALRYRISQLEEGVRLGEAHVATLRSEHADLAHEARVAGADPGWIRVPGSEP